MKRRRLVLPDSYYNILSYLGTLLAAASFIIILFLFFFSSLFESQGSYSGLITYIIMPVFLVAGLLMIALGMMIKHRKLKKQVAVEGPKLPVIDFNNKKVWNAFVIFAPVTLILLLFTGLGTYKAYHYTESVEFCGTLCHRVMEPEYTAYQHSSHARVTCVQCHVGEGAEWYVKAKISGLYQVYAVLANVFPQPIPTPIRNLRPARETCEQCHWPQKFYPQSLVLEKHYLADEENTEWDIFLLMKTGSMVRGKGLNEGIHWHINKDVKIEYVSPDSKRGTIPWVKYTDLKTGKSYIYEDENKKLSSATMKSLEKRTMDCMDCHNRPSHDYKTPMRFFNQAMAAGKISRELPDIKIVAMEILHKDYSSKDSAMLMIKKQVYEYYELMYEDILREKKNLVDQAVKVIQEEYANNIFPFMKVSWDKYPNHIGHLEFNGCFRCHDDKHKTKGGRVISRNCNLCHSIIAQGKSASIPDFKSLNSLEFDHPNDPNQAWKEKLCSECHIKLYKQ